MITNTFEMLTPRFVGGILQLGGTILNTSRSPQFRKRKESRRQAKLLP